MSVATPTITATDSATSYEIQGTSVTLTCTPIYGNGDYVWKFDNAPMYVVSSYDTQNSSNFAKNIKLAFFRNGVTTTRFTVPNTDPSAAGNYTCQVTLFTVTSSESDPYTLAAAGFLDETFCVFLQNIRR